jgi:hypothetical protein
VEEQLRGTASGADANELKRSSTQHDDDIQFFARIYKRSKVVAAVLSSACLLLAAGVFGRALHDTLMWYSPVPFADQVTSVWLTNQWVQHALPLTTVWRWHNEHLIVFPQILYLIDIILFGNRNSFLVVCCWTLQIVHASIFLYVIWKWIRQEYALLSSAAIVAAFFAPTQLENLLSGFQVGYIMTHTFAALAIFFLLRALNRSPRWRDVFLCAMFGTVAAFSFSTGLLVWPLVSLLALKLKFPRDHQIFLAPCGALVWSIILGARAVQVPATLAVHPKAINSWRFLTRMIGATWSAGQSWSTFLSILSLLALAALLFHFVDSSARSACSAFAITMALFSFGWLVLISLGRSSDNPGMSLSSRYQTTVLIYWGCLMVAYLEWALSANWPIVQAASVAFMAALAAAGPTAREHESRLRARAELSQLAESSLKVGIYDPEFAGGALLLGSDTVPQLQISRNRDLSFFSNRLHHLLGTAFWGHFKAKAPCPGRITVKRKIETAYPGIRLAGSKQGRNHLIVVAANGRIVGLGSEVLGHHDRWIAYAQPVREPLTIYSAKGNSACLISSEKP